MAFWLEESLDTFHRLDKSRVWMIDPLDGTTRLHRRQRRTSRYRLAYLKTVTAYSALFINR